jgi:hypothetical protein
MRHPAALRRNGGSPEIGEGETVERFCRSCVFFHDSRARFLPAEAPDLVPPACYSDGRIMPPGWCGGSHYQEDIP